MMKRSFFFVFALFLFLTAACTPQERKGYAPPSLISRTTRAMKSPGFWISQNPSADKVILDAAGIDAFNLSISNKLKLTQDIEKIGPTYPGKELVAALEKTFDDLLLEKRFDKNGRRFTPPLRQAMKEQMNLAKVADNILVRYGFVRACADQRLLPTDEIAVNNPGDVEFDEIQNSSLDIATPLAILHESQDGRWLYVWSPTSDGWIKKADVIICTLADIKNYLEQASFAVIVSPKADIYLDPALTGYFDYARMGSIFPASKDINAKTVQITIPFQDEKGAFVLRTAYVAGENVHLGFLPYTPRNIIGQAFKLLNMPYGWGGAHGEQDCSSFLQEVFATVGIFLPRNSGAQARVGKPLGTFNEHTTSGFKREALSSLAVGGATILQLKGHVLLYLGTYRGEPYAIHETYGYRQKVWHGEVLRKVNRVIVSDLLLGEKTAKGSLLERLLSVRGIE